MNAPVDPRLARRLRALREQGLADKGITQPQLAKAFNASVPLISSWENNTAVPPLNRLEAYARFFATERSVARDPYRVLREAELEPDELERSRELIDELARFRIAALGETKALADRVWQFPPDHDIAILCAELPEELRQDMPYADPTNPDYDKYYRYADLDAMIEIYGHVRALNPTNRVNITIPSESRADLFTAHLLVLGGVDFNLVTRDLLRLINIPIRQIPRRVTADAGGFQVDEGKDATKFVPVLQGPDERKELIEDVAHFYRGPNPLNKKRTLTICSGMYARGTVGAIRALTDPRFRDRNADYIEDRLGLERFSIVTRVRILNGNVVTPDWTRQDVLHQWPEESSEQSGVRS